MNATRSVARQERGYNLVEILIAMGILGSVLLGVFSLFVMGRKNVYSGKQMTRAVAVGTRVMEDLSVLTREDVQRAFCLATPCAPSTPTTAVALSTITAGGKSYPNSVARLSTSTTNDIDGYLARWNALVAAQNFSNGLVTLVVTPVEPRTGFPAATTLNAPIYRIRVVVEWNEEGRRRHVVLDTSKLDRTN
ncbi:MAG TPA: prepilin-type N-terminal cleavage/methylation domain-containing protein [Thermoanaerobaculia bacterium]|nr:prepilin-type N-terminal cleavage/methylation domain-containing protein [Thermoanaerobaculia bacterium]